MKQVMRVRVFGTGALAQELPVVLSYLLVEAQALVVVSSKYCQVAAP